MAIILNPITLPASKMLETMTSLIGDVRFEENLGVSDIVNEMVDSARIGKVDYGKGIINTFKLAPLTRKPLSETSSAFTINKPNIAQETITIDNYYFYEISMSEILSRDALLSGDAVATFMAYCMDLLQDSSQFDLFNEVNNLYQNWTPGQTTQTVQVNQIDTTNLSGAELNNALTWNATEMAKVMRKTLNNMKIPNNKYTDIATFEDINTSETENVISALKTDNLKLVVNDKYWTDFLANSLASLYHSEKIGDMIPGDTFCLLPTDAMTSSNAKTIGWLSSKNKFALADFYRVTLSILDPSTTYQNTFFHIAYGAGVFEYAPGVKFVENTISPGQEGS